MPWKRDIFWAIFSISAVLTVADLLFKLPAGFLNLAFSLFPFWAHCLCWEGCAKREGNVCRGVHQGDPRGWDVIWEFNNPSCSCLIKPVAFLFYYLFTHSLGQALMGQFQFQKLGGKEKTQAFPYIFSGRFCFAAPKVKISLSSHLTRAHISKNMPIITKEVEGGKAKAAAEIKRWDQPVLTLFSFLSSMEKVFLCFSPMQI